MLRVSENNGNEVIIDEHVSHCEAMRSLSLQGGIFVSHDRGVRVLRGRGGRGVLLKTADLVDRNTNVRATQPQPCISYLKVNCDHGASKIIRKAGRW